jgi:hypothetical protein
MGVNYYLLLQQSVGRDAFAALGFWQKEFNNCHWIYKCIIDFILQNSAY